MVLAYFAGLKFRDVAKKICLEEINFAKIVKILGPVVQTTIKLIQD